MVKNKLMSIIESIKNGAKFRLKHSQTKPTHWHYFEGRGLVVFWEDNLAAHTYTTTTEELIELIPEEEEELWVVIPKESAKWPKSEEQANECGIVAYGSGNYTIHKITRTK